MLACCYLELAGAKGKTVQIRSLLKRSENLEPMKKIRQ